MGSGSRAPGLPQQTTALLAALRLGIGAQLPAPILKQRNSAPFTSSVTPSRARALFSLKARSEQGAEMADHRCGCRRRHRFHFSYGVRFASTRFAAADYCTASCAPAPDWSSAAGADPQAEKRNSAPFTSSVTPSRARALFSLKAPSE